MALKASKLSKLYDQKWVLRDVSFEADRGEIFGLFGASGCGKTAVLKLLAGIEKLNGGAIFFESVDVTHQTRDGRGFTFAGARPEPAWSRIFGGDSKLASGTRKLEAINKAADSADKVLLLDDPFSSMDAEQQRSGLEILRRTALEKNLAIVIATNNFDEILLSCEKVAVIVDSEVIQTGTPREVYLNPASHRVARITGKHNLFSARRLTSSKAETHQFQTIDGSHKLAVQKFEKSSLGALNQNVTLGIRPEQISIAFGASFPEDNLIKAAITRIRFLGANTLVELDADGLRLDALVPRLVGLDPGDECMLGLPPDRIAIYKD
jgi:iron(III) transport system ATP-binding protein